MNLTATIKQRATELGFDLVGITTAATPPHASEFRQWLADGCHGEMGYMARRAEARADLQQLLPGVRSVIMVAQCYPTAASPIYLSNVASVTFEREIAGRVARYAAGGGDYHDAMGERLELLAGFLRERGGAAKWYVDTGPVLERDLAQRAGIGFAGKHTNLINRQLGNWFFLGGVLTTLDLPADLPEREYCGTCTRCIAACPTKAIVAPYRLDARLCISYLTIELKGSIPVELRPLIGDRVFGCDDCLEVCPWNRFARPAVTPRDLPALTEMLAWTEQQFADFFRGTPIYRLKRARFLRNICVVLGNSGDPTVLPALRLACDDREPLVREHAAWAVERLTVGR